MRERKMWSEWSVQTSLKRGTLQENQDDSLKEYWDTTSVENLNSLITDHLCNTNDPEREKIRGILKKFQVRSILDAGCGIATEYAGYQLDPKLKSMEYVGVDMSMRMLKLAKARFPSIRFEMSDIEKLPFPDHSFDAVLLKHVLEHQPNGYEKTVQEAIRVARKLVIIDFFHPLEEERNEKIIKITDKDGYANNWIGKRAFEEFIQTQPIARWSTSPCRGVTCEQAVIYTILLPGAGNSNRRLIQRR